MSATLVRALALAVFFAVAIPGMIIASIGDNTGAAVTFGLIAAVVALVLIVASAVTTGRLSPSEVGASAREQTEEQAAVIEARVQAMVRAGADEAEVRDLVRTAMQFARQAPD